MKLSQITNKSVVGIIWINRIQFILALLYTGVFLPLNDLNNHLYIYKLSALGIVYMIFVLYLLVFEYDYFFFEIMPFLLLPTLAVGNNNIQDYLSNQVTIPILFFTDPNTINILKYSIVIFVIITVMLFLAVAIPFFAESSTKNLIMTISETIHSHKAKDNNNKLLEMLPLVFLFFLPMVSTDFLASSSNPNTILSSSEAHILSQYNSFSYYFMNFIGTTYIITGNLGFHITIELILLIAVILTLLPLKNIRWKTPVFILGMFMIIFFLISITRIFISVIGILIGIWLILLAVHIDVEISHDSRETNETSKILFIIIGIFLVIIGVFFSIFSIGSLSSYENIINPLPYSLMAIILTLMASSWLFLPAIVLYFSIYDKRLERDAYILIFMALSTFVLLYFAQFLIPFSLTEFTCTINGYSPCITSFRPSLLIFVLPVLAVKIVNLQSTSDTNVDTNTTLDLAKISGNETT